MACHGHGATIQLLPYCHYWNYLPEYNDSDIGTCVRTTGLGYSPRINVTHFIVSDDENHPYAVFHLMPKCLSKPLLLANVTHTTHEHYSTKIQSCFRSNGHRRVRHLHQQPVVQESHVSRMRTLLLLAR